MDVSRQVCEHCAGDEATGVLTPVHVDIKGLTKTWYFHNRHKNDCLAQFIAEKRAAYQAEQKKPQFQLPLSN